MSPLHSADFKSEYLMGRIEMEYGISINEVKQLGDDLFLAYTPDTGLIIEKSEFKETYIIYVAGLYEYVKNNGFDNIAKLYTTQSGKYYAAIDGDCYRVSKYNNDENFTFDKNERSIIRLIAEFHKCSAGYSPPCGGKSKADWGKWIEKYRKEYRFFKKHINIIKDKDNKTAFEKLCLKYCSKYIEKMEQSIEILKKNNYLDIVEDSMRKRQICISSFKKSNFYRDNEEIFIKSLDKCRYDIVEKDIAEFLQKLIQYKKTKHVKSLSELIILYNKINPLDKDSLRIIKAFLLYPEEYEKICSKYFRGKTKWTEEIYMSKLKDAVDFEEKKAVLIDAIDDIKLYSGRE